MPPACPAAENARKDPRPQEKSFVVRKKCAFGTYTNKPLRSAGGFRGPLRSLTTKNKQNANEADRKVNDFRCKLTTCKWHGLHAQENSPDAACMYGIENTERKSNETSYYCEIGNLAKSFALPISC